MGFARVFKGPIQTGSFSSTSRSCWEVAGQQAASLSALLPQKGRRRGCVSKHMAFLGRVCCHLCRWDQKKLVYLGSGAVGHPSRQPARSIIAQVAMDGRDCCARFQLKADLLQTSPDLQPGRLLICRGKQPRSPPPSLNTLVSFHRARDNTLSCSVIMSLS